MDQINLINMHLITQQQAARLENGQSGVVETDQRAPKRVDGKLIMRVLSLSLLLFGLLSIDFLGLKLAETTAVPGRLLLLALLDTAVLTIPIRRTRWHGWRLVLAIFLLFYGLTTFLVGVETLYLGDILPPEVARRLFLNGFVTAVIFAPAAVLAHGRMGAAELLHNRERPAISWKVWPLKLLLLGLIWAVLFVAFGLLVFMPLANALDPAALAAYAGLDMPAWILLFQAGRGVIMAGLALPLLALLDGRRWQIGLIVGLLFAVLMSANLLLATGLAPALQLAHFVELFGENFIFGVIVTFLFARRVANVPETAVSGEIISIF